MDDLVSVLPPGQVVRLDAHRTAARGTVRPDRTACRRRGPAVVEELPASGGRPGSSRPTVSQVDGPVSGRVLGTGGDGGGRPTHPRSLKQDPDPVLLLGKP